MAKNDKSIQSESDSSSNTASGSMTTSSKKEFILINNTGINQELSFKGKIYQINPGKNLLPIEIKNSIELARELTRKKYLVKEL